MNTNIFADDVANYCPACGAEPGEECRPDCTGECCDVGCPDICPVCGVDLQAEGYPVGHKTDAGDECSFRWDPRQEAYGGCTCADPAVAETMRDHGEQCPAGRRQEEYDQYVSELT